MVTPSSDAISIILVSVFSSGVIGTPLKRTHCLRLCISSSSHLSLRWWISFLHCRTSLSWLSSRLPGADPGFQVRGDALNKIAPSGGRLENCWGISCQKSRFYAKKSYFFPILGGAHPLDPPLQQ